MKKLLIAALAVCGLVLLACQSGSNETAVETPAEVTVGEEYATEIAALAGNEKVKTAFKHVTDTQDQMIRDLITLVEIPAPSFHEEKRAKKFAEMLEAAGADRVWIDEVGNVLALRKGTKGDKTVLIEGHMDTVFPIDTDVTVKVRGDTLFAPGIGDDTRALALVLQLLRAMNYAVIETEADVIFCGTVCEEGLGDLKGVKHLFSDDGPGIDSYIAIDGGMVGRIINGGVGSHRYRVTFKGPGGHSLGAFGLVNPHHALGRAVYYFVEGADPYTSVGPRTTYNVGVIGGGTSVNSIPYESWMVIDMRSESQEKLQGVDEILQNAVQRALDEANALLRHGPKMTVDVEMIGNRPSGETDPSQPLVQRAIAASKHFGKEPRIGWASTNSNLPISKGVPAVTIGRGGPSGNTHNLQEWWVNGDQGEAVFNAMLVLLAEAGMVQ